MAMHILLTLLIFFLATDRSHAQVCPTVTSSLTYLVDTTGSMHDDIQQLHLVNNWILDRTVAQFPCGVRQYTMVEFNDPSMDLPLPFSNLCFSRENISKTFYIQLICTCL
ncbi:hypothetical protein XENTR_v10023994 [Xenopus tropicalis]|nr:hypothetical protein XENTR_v10023994 [Xenopus tropicalis]